MKTGRYAACAAVLLLAACSHQREPEPPYRDYAAESPDFANASSATSEVAPTPLIIDAGTAPAHDVGAMEPDVCFPGSNQAGEVTLANLISELVDLRSLTHRPDPPYRSALQSSHNPASDAAKPGSGDWFADQDFVALQDGETRTLLDVAGPGALTRFWSASPAGTLRIYLDGAEQPIVDAPLVAFLDGAIAPFVLPFSFEVAGGHNLYFPIPFAHGCRVTLTGKADPVYYQIAYRTYPSGTPVQSYGEEALRDSECARTLASKRLLDLRPDSDLPAYGTLQAFDLNTTAPYGTAVIDAGEQGGMLWQLRFVLEDLRPETLRSTLLSIAFDDVETVRVPLGDFFASGVSLSEINAVPIGVLESGVLTARWPMPFQRRAQLTLESEGATESNVHLEVVSSAETWTEQSLYFHAQWRAPETFASKPTQDWNLATIAGTGLYVGNVLNVVNRSASWWGEGDEKIYVDGEAFPSAFGTGTEDYYGYAWCANQRFAVSYVGQPVTSDRQNFGYVSLYRFHVLDAIAFQTALRFDLEVRHWGPAVDVTYDAVSFWYARPGSTLAGAPPDAAGYALPALDAAVPDDAGIGPYRCGG